MSPDSVSSQYPDRPIRPLPKRRLRERLSPDVADTITYPPAPQNATPLFYYPYNLKNESGVAATEAGNVVARANRAELAQETGSRRSGLGGEHDDESLMYQARRALMSQPFHETSEKLTRTPPRASHGRQPHPQPPPSTASSADGYDSFENTNNKKKRKIPTAGDHVLSGAHVLSDSSILGVPSPPTTGDEGPGDSPAIMPSPYVHPGVTYTNGQRISGPGRGLFGKNRNCRSPLKQLPNTLNSNVLNSNSRVDGQYPTSHEVESTGIISNAIANAENLPVPAGQENVSLFQQEASSKANPAHSTFTFSIDSPASGRVSFPDSVPPKMTGSQIQPAMLPDYRDPYYGANARTTSTGQIPLSGAAATQSAGVPSLDGPGKGPAPAPAQQKKPKRRGDPLRRAAKERRQQAEYQNYHHPPASEDVWICEFCEYERIFGEPPVALIRQYEIKDRRRRREEAERRRLLEKAKMKSRKGKKTSKLPAKNNAPAQDRNPAPAAGHQAPPAGNDPGQDIPSEEYEEDDYYEDDLHDDNCPSVAPGQEFDSHAASLEAARYWRKGGGSGEDGRDTRVSGR
ncbi:hypothetical protein BJ170DRAFT_598074 [Xylariales sp. AK1849]|nr:hypothetical protein BJ170DRAFT_598074 [Xylariales sp. AK1849]